MSILKYKLRDTVHYLINNKMHSADIVAIKSVQNIRDDSCDPFGSAGVQYRTCHGVFLEQDVYKSKQDLVAELLSE